MEDNQTYPVLALKLCEPQKNCKVLRNYNKEVLNYVLAALWVLRCVVPVMRFVAHRFLFQYGAATTVADLEKSTHF